ncbi:chromate transport protein ChrA [Bosea sp. BIWAKO-01]|nr:chromate transport protein ChrA [Bosea sp. BIWAKO-01]
MSGGAYAVLVYVAQAAVETYGWLAAGDMGDGLGLAETTPGPLILVLQFSGFLAGFRAPGSLPPILAGGMGALLTLWVTFAPCFLWIFLGAPYVEALRGNRGLSAASSAITAAVVGVIANLALWFGLHVLFREIRRVELLGLAPDLPVLTSLDWRGAVLALAAMIAMLRFKVAMIPTLAACAPPAVEAICLRAQSIAPKSGSHLSETFDAAQRDRSPLCVRSDAWRAGQRRGCSPGSMMRYSASITSTRAVPGRTGAKGSRWSNPAAFSLLFRRQAAIAPAASTTGIRIRARLAARRNSVTPRTRLAAMVSQEAQRGMRVLWPASCS